MVISRLKKTLPDFCQLDCNLPILLGVSGGPDSLCLMDALHRLGWKPVVACFDHGLRPESGKEVLLVQAAAEEHGVTFVTGGLDVRTLARKENLSLEEAARTARYKFLFEQAHHFNAQAVAVAHTADDQVETVLMHFLRGSGLTGLRGMAFRSILPEWNPTLPVVRPMLGIWREEVLNYCLEQGLQPIMDSSNQDTKYFRNRLRHELLPILKEYNPQVKMTMWRMAQSLAGDYADLEREVDELVSAYVLEAGDGYTVISYPAVKTLSPGMQRNFLRKITARIHPGLRDIDYEAVERALAFIHSPTHSRRIDWISGLLIYLDRDRLVISSKGGQFISGQLPRLEKSVNLLSLPGQAILGDGWQLEANLVTTPYNQAVWDQGDPYRAWFDADTLKLPLLIRPTIPGDRFRPLGMEGHSLKLSDFFINVHLVQHARQQWPLVVSDNEIAWIPGYRLAHNFRVTEQTRRIIQLRLIHSD